MAVPAILLACSLAVSSAPPLGVAAITPHDVDAVIQIRGRLPSVQSVGGRMLQHAASGLMESLGVADRWRQASEAAGMKPAELLDRCAGRDASLLIRRREEASEWVLALEIAPGEACDLLKAVGGRVTGSRRFEIPGLGLCGAGEGDWLLVTDDARSTLLRDMHRVACDGDVPSLASELPESDAANESAAVMVAVRHAGDSAGHSVWALMATPRGLRVEAQGRLSADPFGAVVDGPEPEMMLEAMPQETVACWMQPRPVRPLPAAACETCGGSVTPDVVDTLGGRMAVLVGPGRAGPVAVAVAFEVRDARQAGEVHDRALAALASCEVGDRVAQTCLSSGSRLESPRDLTWTGLGPRLFAGLEAVASNQLHARTVCMPVGGWRVYANERRWLDRVVAALEEHPVESPASTMPPRWTRTGFVQGGPMAAALQAWADRRATQGRCDRGVRLLARWAALTDVVTWKLSQTDTGRFEAGIEISPALSPTDQGESTLAIRP